MNKAPEKVVLAFLKVGEYDLINISLLGRDPITGRSFEECHEEWKKAVDYAIWCENHTKPWQLLKRLRNRIRANNLQVRFGVIQ